MWDWERTSKIAWRTCQRARKSAPAWNVTRVRWAHASHLYLFIHSYIYSFIYSFCFYWRIDSCSKAYNYILKLSRNKKTGIEVKFKISSRKGTSSSKFAVWWRSTQMVTCVRLLTLPGARRRQRGSGNNKTVVQFCMFVVLHLNITKIIQNGHLSDHAKYKIPCNFSICFHTADVNLPIWLMGGWGRGRGGGLPLTSYFDFNLLEIELPVTLSTATRQSVESVVWLDWLKREVWVIVSLSPSFTRRPCEPNAHSWP